MKIPPRIELHCCVSAEGIARNRAAAPRRPDPHGSGKLAIVGGSASLELLLPGLREWKGDIWAINGTCKWLRERGIESYFYTVDPSKQAAEYAIGATKAVVADQCDPEMFKNLRNAEVFTLKGELPGVTSAVAGSSCAITAGYEHVTFFGCAGSGDYAYINGVFEWAMKVKVGEKVFDTNPEFLAQSEQLSNIIRLFPLRFGDASGGLLGALVDHDTYEVMDIRRNPMVKLGIHAKPAVSDEVSGRNHMAALERGLPWYGNVKRSGPLAIVGGGPTIETYKGLLKNWKGDVWAINGAWKWCERQGIDATFCASDPHERVLDWVGGRKAMLETIVDPKVIDYFADGEVVLWEGRGSCTATALCEPALQMGYESVTLFGCEGSYTIMGTHAYQNEDREEEIILQVRGQMYLTAPDFMIQATELADLIISSKGKIRESSSGLLRALVIANGEYGVAYMSPALRKQPGWRAKLTDVAIARDAA